MKARKKKAAQRAAKRTTEMKEKIIKIGGRHFREVEL